MRHYGPTPAQMALAEREVNEFNARYPLGAAVTYHPIRWENGEFDGEPKQATIRSEAFVSNSGHSVVFLTGISGYVHTAHVVKRTLDEEIEICSQLTV